MASKHGLSFWQSGLIGKAVINSFLKLSPIGMLRNPVMLTVEIGAVITTIITVSNIFFKNAWGFNLQVSCWLWVTVLFANFAESLAEAQGKAQAETLKRARSDVLAKKLLSDGSTEEVAGLCLVKGDSVMVEEGDIIPSDGEIVEGVALVDESAITGESAPVIREGGGDRSGVTGGTKVLSGKIKVVISAEQGKTFLDQMINMIESAKRHKTPNEIALEILLNALTVLFIGVVVTLNFYAEYMSVPITVPVLIALLVCLIPTTIGGLLPAIGIAGMDRLMRKNVIALSGRAVEAAGDVNIVLLDKTGTITLGNRLATEFIVAEGVSFEELANAALLASLSDDTPEGRSIVLLAKEKLGLRGRDIKVPEGARFIKFSPETRISGIDYGDKRIRKGAVDAIEGLVGSEGISLGVRNAVDEVSIGGGTPLIVEEDGKVLGVVRLRDVLKEGIKERLHALHLMGIKSIMITGDNPLTAASIAAEAGVSDFIAQARPEVKLKMIREYQTEGYMVAMIGDGTNDAPALAQADVAVAMNGGTQAAREAANMVDLDSSPTKLLDIVEIGKQILITRGSLTTFSIANDVAKYFAIIPAVFTLKYPMVGVLNVMALATPESAILSAIIFNAIIIPCLIPLALRGVKARKSSETGLLKRNLVIYGVFGIILPFLGIKLIDEFINLFMLV